VGRLTISINDGFGRPTFGGAAPLNLVDFFRFDVALTRGELGLAGYHGHAQRAGGCAKTRWLRPPGTYANFVGGWGQRGPLILFQRAAALRFRAVCFCR
jgi:hypothetical protein